MIVGLEKDETVAGSTRGAFDRNSMAEAVGEAVQPMDRSLTGQQLMNAVQSAMPKVTSYPY